MELNPQQNRELQDLQAKYNDRRMLWTHIEKYNVYQHDWYKGNFMNLDSEVIEKEMRTFENGIIQLKTRLQNLLPKDATEDLILKQHSQKIIQL